MEQLIIIMIVIGVVVFKAIRAVREQQGESGGDGWWEEETPSSSAQPGRDPSAPAPAGQAKPRRQPSPHVQDILRQLQQQAQGARTPPPTPPSTPPKVVVRPQRRPAPMEPREYLDEQEIEQALARKARSEAHAQAGHVQGQSLRTAFPAAMAVPLASKKAGSERPAIRVLARGRRGLRQAILLGEALGPPRAFDV